MLWVLVVAYFLRDFGFSFYFGWVKMASLFYCFLWLNIDCFTFKMWLFFEFSICYTHTFFWWWKSMPSSMASTKSIPYPYPYSYPYPFPCSYSYPCSYSCFSVWLCGNLPFRLTVLKRSPKPKLGDLLPRVLPSSWVKSHYDLRFTLGNRLSFEKEYFCLAEEKFTVSCTIDMHCALELTIVLICFWWVIW